MAFRGYFALDGVEFVNSSRTASHLGHDVPTSDVGILIDISGGGLAFIEDPPGSGLYDTPPLIEDPPGSGLYDPDPAMSDSGGLYPVSAGECTLVPADGHPGLFNIPASSGIVGDPARRLYSPPNGSRRYSKGLISVGDTCWDAAAACGNCRSLVTYDDTWPGLQTYLSDPLYRPELAPWYSTRLAQSREFLGVWLLDVKGLDTTPVERQITELAGSGAAAAPFRDTSRTITFDALMLACTNAGLQYGMDWLTCLLRDTNARTDAVLQYLSAHPSYSGADPVALMREAHNVVLTKAPDITEAHVSGGAPNQQATVYHITWEMVALSPYAYLPPVNLNVVWDTVVSEPIEWVHAADCGVPDVCVTMPVLFSTDCIPETIDVVNTPPPSCGGCMPVCALDSYVYEVPTFDYVVGCRETAATITVKNTGARNLTLQSYWRPCDTNLLCDIQYFPVQISGLQPQASIVLDAISGRAWALLDGIKRRQRNIVGTPNGAPWVPAIIDRGKCWEFVVQAPSDVDFTVNISLADREP